MFIKELRDILDNDFKCNIDSYIYGRIIDIWDMIKENNNEELKIMEIIRFVCLKRNGVLW